MIKIVIRFFDKLEDRVRGKLSRYPIVYALIGGVGVILFWRGIWHTADYFPALNGPVSTIIGIVILFMTGIFVSAFIGNSLLITGLRGEKKLTEKTKEEVDVEESSIEDIKATMQKIEKELSEIKEELPHHHDK
jgi:hypothetical protein